MEGGSLSKMPGLIREARDLQGIKEGVVRRRAAKQPTRRAPGGEAKPARRGKTGGTSGGGEKA